MCTNPTLAYITKKKIWDIKYHRWQRRDKVCLYKEAEYKNLWDQGKLVANTVKIPCRKCDECKATEASAWSARITTEAKKHKYNYFLTLTYNDEELKKNNNKTEKKEIQLFIKKLRNAGLKFKYYAVGEYGAKTGRPYLLAGNT